VVGVGRPLAVWPDLGGRFVRGETDVLRRPAPRLGGPAAVRGVLAPAANSGWHRIQLARTADGLGPLMRLPAMLAALDYAGTDSMLALRGRKARLGVAAQAAPPAHRELAHPADEPAEHVAV
jgi:hypothetical protein